MSVKHVHVANSHGLFIVNALVGEGEGGGGPFKKVSYHNYDENMRLFLYYTS